MNAFLLSDCVIKIFLAKYRNLAYVEVGRISYPQPTSAINIRGARLGKLPTKDNSELSCVKDTNARGRNRVQMSYDFFINHCRTEKSSCAIPLYTHLKSLGFSVWFDISFICFGDDIFKTIEEGIRQSKWCISIISKDFLLSHWPMKELDIFFNIDTNGDEANILPIYYKISKEEVCASLPQLTNIAFEVIDEDIVDSWIDHILSRIIGNFFAKSTPEISWEELLSALKCESKNQCIDILHILINQFLLNLKNRVLSIVNLYNITGICMLSQLEHENEPNREMRIGFNYVQKIASRVFLGSYKVSIYELESAEAIARSSVCSVINLIKNSNYVT